MCSLVGFPFHPQVKLWFLSVWLAGWFAGWLVGFGWLAVGLLVCWLLLVLVWFCCWCWLATKECEECVCFVVAAPNGAPDPVA